MATGRQRRKPHRAAIHRMPGLPVGAQVFDPPDAPAGDGVILYVYGGVFIMNSGPMHARIAERLAKEARQRVILPEYRLAPEHPFPAALLDIAGCWNGLVAQGADPERSVIVADSAGCSIALAAMIKLRDEGAALPGGFAAISPWVDLTFSGASYIAQTGDGRRISDFELMVEFSLDYLQGAPPGTPLASPVFADLGGLPEALIHAWSGDPVADDAPLLAARLRGVGVRAHLHIWDDLPLSWQRLSPLDGQKAAVMASIGQFARRIARAPSANGKGYSGDLEHKYRAGVADRIEPHMEARVSEIFRWAQDHAPGWVWPMIRQRIEHGPLVTQQELEREWLLSAFDRSADGLLLLTAGGHVLVSNRSAEAMLAAGAPLAISDGRLLAAPRKIAVGFDALLASLFGRPDAPDGSGARQAMLLADRSGGPARWWLDARRLEGRTQGAAPPVALLRLVREDTAPALRPQSLMEGFGLTRREAELACAFAAGTGLADFAHAGGISLATVRSHFAHVKAKLAARDQAEVVRRVLICARD